MHPPVALTVGALAATAAGAAEAIADPLGVLVNGGILGIIVVLLLTGKLAPGRELERMEDRAEKAEAEVVRLRERTEERIIPALIDVTRIMAQVARRLEDRS